MTDRKFRMEDLTLGTIGFDDMTLGDMEDIMDAAGIDLATFGRDLVGKPFTKFPPKALSAFIWVENRKKMKGLTLEDIRELPGDRLLGLLGTEPDDSPKESLTPDTS